MLLLFRRSLTMPYVQRASIFHLLTLVLLVSVATELAEIHYATAAEPKRTPNTSPAAVKQQRRDPTLQPPDGKWLTDEQGRFYFLNRLPKKHAVRIDEQTVRTWGAIPIAVIKEDDEYYYFKVYQTTTPTSSAKGGGSASTKIEPIATLSQPATPTSQKLQVTSFSQGLPTSGQWRQGFAIADMNGDGHLDIVHGPARKTLQPPVIFLGDGKGTWMRWQEARYPTLPFDYGDAQVGDLNGDGQPDLVLGVHLRGLLALTNDGHGNFAEARAGIDFAANAKQGTAFSSQAIQLADWNGDGRLDIVALSEGPQLGHVGASPGALVSRPAQGVVVYLNNGDGSWTRQDSNADSRPVFGSSLTLGDFNGDGRRDFATGSYVQGRKDIVNLGKADGSWETITIDSLRPTALLHSVVAGDFDRNGRDDLAVAYLSYEAEKWRTGIDIFYFRQDGQWQRRALLVEEGQQGVVALGVGDVDGDQQRDLVALTEDGRTLLFPNDGAGFFSRDKMKIPPFGNGCRGSHVALADLDGDGNDDIIASFSSEARSEDSELEKVSRGADPVCPTEGGLAAWRVTPQQTVQQSR